MPWLVCDGDVVAALEVARTRRARGRGLLGRDGIEGALLLRPASSVHTFGMRFAIDVAVCDRELVVVRIVTMRPQRLGRPTWQGRAVIEAEAGSLATWGVRVGSRLAVAH